MVRKTGNHLATEQRIDASDLPSTVVHYVVTTDQKLRVTLHQLIHYLNIVWKNARCLSGITNSVHFPYSEKFIMKKKKIFNL